MEKKYHLNFIDYILVFMLIAISGLNYFYLVKTFITVAFLINIFVLFIRKINIRPKELTFILILVILEIIQGVFFKTFSFVSISGIFMRLAIGYLTIKILGKKFIPAFININLVFSLISIPIFLFTFSSGFVNFMINNITPLFPPLEEFNTDQFSIHPNIILYTFNPAFIYDNIRNSGPYYEPGMFAIFLNISLLFSLIINEKKYSYTNIILLITIITTFSTAGYLGLFFIIIGLYFNFQKAKSILFLLTFLFTAIYLFNTLDFLGDKIDKNIQGTDRTTSRFGSLMADLVYIYKSPIIGNSRLMFERMKIAIWDSETRHRNNGLSKLMVNYGIPFTIYFFVLVFGSFKKVIINNHSKYPHVIPLFVILSLGFSQTLFQYAFFLSLPFLGFVYKPVSQIYKKK